MMLALGAILILLGLLAAAAVAAFIRAWARDKREERDENTRNRETELAWHREHLEDTGGLRKAYHAPPWEEILHHQLPVTRPPAGAMGLAQPRVPAGDKPTASAPPAVETPGPALAPPPDAPQADDGHAAPPGAQVAAAAGPGAHLVGHPDPSLWLGHAETYPATPEHMAHVIAAEATLDYPHPIGWYTEQAVYADADAGQAGAA